MSRHLRWVAVVLLVLGGMGYADWVLQLVLPVRADLATSFISELSAAGQPYAEVFRVSDLVAAIMFGLGAALAWALARSDARVWAPLVLLAACAVFETAAPLSASYTFGAELPEPGTGSWWAKVTEPHGVASFVETVSFLVALLTCTLALRRLDAAIRWRRALLTVGVVAALCGALDAVLTATLLLHGDAVGLGLVQRLSVSLTALWLAAAPTWLLLLSRPGQGSRDTSSSSDTRRPV